MFTTELTSQGQEPYHQNEYCCLLSGSWVAEECSLGEWESWSPLVSMGCFCPGQPG